MCVRCCVLGVQVCVCVFMVVQQCVCVVLVMCAYRCVLFVCVCVLVCEAPMIVFWSVRKHKTQ
jgi:hypothetical protein